MRPHPAARLTWLFFIFGAQAVFAEDPKASPIDPAALQALDRMGAFLREQKAFSLTATSDLDEVLLDGQKVTLSSTVDLHVRRPNRLRADIVSDRKERRFFYDGKTFTLFSPRVGYYAMVPAPATLAELTEVLADRYDVELPLVDLFYWGTEKSSAEQITSALDVGPAHVGTVACEHFAFRQPDLDWQIWIEKGPRALPHKLVITTTNETAHPQYTVRYQWALDSKKGDKVFTFVPPKDSHRIQLGSTSPGVD